MYRFGPGGFVGSEAIQNFVFFFGRSIVFFRGEDERVQSLARTIHQQAPSTQSSTQLSTPTPEAATCYLPEIYTLW
jgi:hypothetical protein